MSDAMLVLNLLEEERITIEEALQLLSIQGLDKPPHKNEGKPKIEVNLTFERGVDV